MSAICPHCNDTGHVCENHPEHAWAGITGGEECCGGAGMPCQLCCDPPRDGESVIAAFTPRKFRQ
jgi:hypothetical protein